MRKLTVHLGKAGKRWRVERETLLGLCEYRSRTITIAISGSRRDLIDTCVHEILHAEFPRMRHRRIRRVAAACAKVIESVLCGKRR